MFDVVCVTNRHLSGEDFLRRMERIAASKPSAVILREKDLTEADYEALAEDVLALCRKHGVLCILHSFPEVARRLQADGFHVPMGLLRKMSDVQRAGFPVLGASCHSVEEAQEAEALGCSYVTAGHVFRTDCKAGVPPKGLDFLRRVCDSVDIPVWAIGGIDAKNLRAVQKVGAAGGCIMSGFMKCEEPKEFVDESRRRIDEIE